MSLSNTVYLQNAYQIWVNFKKISDSEQRELKWESSKENVWRTDKFTTIVNEDLKLVFFSSYELEFVMLTNKKYDSKFATIKRDGNKLSLEYFFADKAGRINPQIDFSPWVKSISDLMPKYCERNELILWSY